LSNRFVKNREYNQSEIRPPINKGLMMKFRFAFLLGIICVLAASLQVQAQTPPPPPPPPPAAASKQPPPRINKGGDAEMAFLISKVPPVYPKAAIDARVQGTVKLKTVIDTDGSVIEATYVSGPTMLVQASIDCVKQWKFKPALLQGVPAQVECTFEVSFHLDK
jgi:protein TonB